ncbi:acyl-CoA dehydrogenase family protein [Streptomyces sp. NPDC005963]|uniref:acyl-CoA dehydrogenase family protein n=1 Tax=Streptomyces sp. NPDC005963 TaxID=3156721 RepID=UPI0033C9E23F
MDSAAFKEVLEAVRRFIREDVVPREREIELTDEVPADIRRKAVDMGLFGYTLPEEYGGMGARVEEDARLCFEFGHTSLAFRSMFGTNIGIAGQVLVNYGTAEQRETWLPRLAEGAVASFALTEAEAGSDPSGMKTRAVDTGDGHYEISGAKRFITNAAVADVFMVFARSGEGERTTDGISCFLVEKGAPGLVIGPKDAKTGQAGAWTSEVFFDGVRVPHSALVGGSAGQGFNAAMRSLAKGRIHVAALCVGQATRALEESVEYARHNKQGGEPIGRFQLVQAMLAESRAELDAARALVLDVARRYDSGEDTKIGPSTAKLFATEMADRVADRAVQIHGGMGYMRETTVERISRDVRVMRIYEGTSEVQKLIIGRALLRG